MGGEEELVGRSEGRERQIKLSGQVVEALVLKLGSIPSVKTYDVFRQLKEGQSRPGRVMRMELGGRSRHTCTGSQGALWTRLRILDGQWEAM